MCGRPFCFGCEGDKFAIRARGGKSGVLISPILVNCISMNLYIIANPVAGRGKARRLTSSLLTQFRQKGASINFEWTAMPGHGRTLARATSRTVDAVVAVGGDGTAHEVARGLLDSGLSIPLAIAPFGSGNDYARALNLPRQPDRVAATVLAGRHRSIDYGTVAWEGEDSAGEDIFLNALGCGFDAFVAREVRHETRLRGQLRYLAAALKSLRVWQNPEVLVTWEDDAGVTARWNDHVLLCTTGIGASSGGGFLLTPQALLDDGLLDVCIARQMPLTRILQVLPMAMRGRHIDAPEVTYVRACSIRIRADAGVPVHVDGEVIPADVHTLSARVVPAGLTVVCP